MTARRRLSSAPSSSLVAFRVTDEERFALVVEARERGLDVSALVRLAVAELLSRRGARRPRRAPSDGPKPAAALAHPRSAEAAAVVATVAPLDAVRRAVPSAPPLPPAEPDAPAVAEAPAPAASCAPELLERPALVDPLGELLATVRAAAAPGLEVPLVVVVALVGDEAEASAGLAELAARGDVVLEGDLVRVARP